jgi:cell division protein FtsB
MTQSKRRRSYVREIVLIICIVAVSGILFYSLFGPGGYRDLQKARMDLYGRQTRVRALEIDIERRTANANAIDEDALKSGRPEALEMLEKKAREHGYARQGEYIQRIIE